MTNELLNIFGKELKNITINGFPLFFIADCNFFIICSKNLNYFEICTQ